MADGIRLNPVTEVTGQLVATDDLGVSKGHAQIIKLNGGGDGIDTPIVGTTADGLYVEMRRGPKATTSGTGASDVPGSPKAIPTATSVRVTVSAPRKRVVLHNPNDDVTFYVRLDTAASASSYHETIPPLSSWWDDVHEGEVYVYQNTGFTKNLGVTVL